MKKGKKKERDPLQLDGHCAAATMPKALPPGGKSMLWRKLATDTEGEATVKGLSVWPIEGWTVSKHTKKDSSSYFL